MNQMTSTLAKLLHRGDIVAIVNGKLVIEPKSGKSVPDGYMDKYGQAIIVDAINSMGAEAYQYTSFKTGNYGQHKAGGLTLQFANIATGETGFVCFNANLKHQRNSKHGKKGNPLPIKQFSVSRRSSFYNFWLTAKLSPPSSPTRFYDRMGKLKDVIFLAEKLEGEKLRKKTIAPLNITFEQLLSTHNFRISSAFVAHKERITSPHKDLALDQLQQGLEPYQSTCEKKCGKKVIREYGYKGNVIPISNTVIDQSTDEWLSDYGD